MYGNMLGKFFVLRKLVNCVNANPKRGQMLLQRKKKKRKITDGVDWTIYAFEHFFKGSSGSLSVEVLDRLGSLFFVLFYRVNNEQFCLTYRINTLLIMNICENCENFIIVRVLHLAIYNLILASTDHS